MSSVLVKKYLTQDFDIKDKKSYLRYCQGNKLSTRWMTKALARREPLLLLGLKCSYVNCDSWINISEIGQCKCINNHNCNQKVSNLIYLGI